MNDHKTRETSQIRTKSDRNPWKRVGWLIVGVFLFALVCGYGFASRDNSGLVFWCVLIAGMLLVPFAFSGYTSRPTGPCPACNKYRSYFDPATASQLGIKKKQLKRLLAGKGTPNGPGTICMCASCRAWIFICAKTNVAIAATDEDLPGVSKWILPISRYACDLPEGSICCESEPTEVIDLSATMEGAEGLAVIAGVAGALAGGKIGGELAHAASVGLVDSADARGFTVTFSEIPVCEQHRNQVSLELDGKLKLLILPSHHAKTRFRAANRVQQSGSPDETDN